MHIVIMDCDNSRLAHLEEILEQSNPNDKIFCFNDSDEALDYIEQQPVEEVFVEVNMNKITGFELTRQIKEMSRQIKVILVSKNSEYAMEAWNVHADYFLKRPITYGDIIKMRE